MLNSKGYVVLRDKDSHPVWNAPGVPEIAGQNPSLQEEERAYRSWHSGFGYSDFLADNTYHYCSVNASADPAATVGGLDPRFPRQVILGPLVTTVTQTTNGGSVSAFFEKGSYLYTLSGRYCNRIDPSNDGVAATGGFPNDFGATVVSTMALPFDSKIYIAFAASPATHLVSFDGSSFVSDDDSKQGNYLAKFWADTAWAMAQAHLSGSSPSVAWVAQAAEPFTAANWSSAYEIGDQDSVITGMDALERTIYVGKTDGLYYIDKTGRSPRLIPAMPKDSTNGSGTAVDMLGYVWYPTKAGLYRYDPNSGVIYDVSPGNGLPNRSPIIGTRRYLGQYRSWYYCSVYDGTHSYIMAGRVREGEEPGVGQIIWHGALARISSAQVTAGHVSALVSPARLWFGLSTGNVAYIKLPANGDNPLSDSGSTYSSGGSIYLPADDYGVGGMRWNLMAAVLEAEGLSTNTNVQVWERRDLGTWTLLQAITSSGRTVITTTGDKRFNRCELRLDVANASSTTTPVIRVAVQRAARRPQIRDMIQTTLVCSDALLSRYGIQMREAGQTMLDNLKGLDEYYPVTLDDWWTGTKRSRTVIVMPVNERIVGQKGEESADQVADITMRVVS